MVDWSSDRQNVLLMGTTDTVLLNTVSKQHTVLLKHSKHQLAHAGFSPDRGLTAAPESGWIPVTDAATWHDKVEWAPNGNLLYFTSDQDGFHLNRSFQMK
jgi:hypothetical protein